MIASGTTFVMVFAWNHHVINLLDLVSTLLRNGLHVTKNIKTTQSVKTVKDTMTVMHMTMAAKTHHGITATGTRQVVLKNQKSQSKGQVHSTIGLIVTSKLMVLVEMKLKTFMDAT